MNIKFLILPERISGDIDLGSLRSVDGLARPHHFGGRFLRKLIVN